MGNRLFTISTALIIGFVFSATSYAGYGKRNIAKIDTVWQQHSQTGNKGKQNAQTVQAGDYVVVTATDPITSQPTGKCYGLNIVKVTKDYIEFFLEVSTMGKIQQDKKKKRIKLGEEKEFDDFGLKALIKAEKGDSTGTVKLIFR
jgi:hypothetical protein